MVVEKRFPILKPDKLPKIKNIVKLMLKYEDLLGRWLDLSAYLEINPVTVQKWKDRWPNINYYELFSDFIQAWLSAKERTIHDLCHILREEMDLEKLAEDLEEAFGKDAPILPYTSDETYQEISKTNSNGAKGFVRDFGVKIERPITYGLMEPARNFSGREEEFKKLSFYFEKSPISKDIYNFALVCGIGGIGKTDFCRTFANDILFGVFRIEKGGCIWLEGETFETLRDSVLKLAAELGVTFQPDDALPTPSEYLEYLMNNIIIDKCDRVLIVIDNMDVNNEEVKNVLKMLKRNKRNFVIIISRDKSVLGVVENTIHLDVLKENEAKAMLNKSNIIGLTDSDANKLCHLVGYFPLALQQAVTYIKLQKRDYKTPNYSVSDYIEDFNKNKKKMLGYKLNNLENEYSMTTLVTLNVTIEKLSKESVEILNILAHVDTDGIELADLERVYCRKKLQDFDTNFKPILNYCLVNLEDGIVSVNSLVQYVIKFRKTKGAKGQKPFFPSKLFILLLFFLLFIWVFKYPKNIINYY